jgi:hypothetical protein
LYICQKIFLGLFNEWKGIIMIERITHKPLVYTNARDMADITNEFARYSKSYALNLMAEGYRADITAKDIKKATQNIPAYNKKGFMTKIGRQQMLETIQTIFNVTQKEAKKVTVGEFVSRTLAVLGKF